MSYSASFCGFPIISLTFSYFFGGEGRVQSLIPRQTFIQQKKRHLIACVREIVKHHMPNSVSSTK